jgi:hypothetical protein
MLKMRANIDGSVESLMDEFYSKHVKVNHRLEQMSGYQGPTSKVNTRHIWMTSQKTHDNPVVI